MAEFDDVIVGGGSAGITLATRRGVIRQPRP